MPPHHPTARQGCGPRRGMVWAPPGPPLTHLPLISFSLPTKHTTIAQTRVLAALARDFSISLLSPSLLLKFGPFALRYVTPPFIQVELCLIVYVLSILVL